MVSLFDPCRKTPGGGTAACSSVLAWRILRTEEAAGCGPWIRKGVSTPLEGGRERTRGGEGGAGRVPPVLAAAPRSRGRGPEQEVRAPRCERAGTRRTRAGHPGAATGIRAFPRPQPASGRQGAFTAATPALLQRRTRGPAGATGALTVRGSARAGTAVGRSVPGGLSLCFWLRPRASPGRGRGPGGCTPGGRAWRSLAARRRRSSRPAVRPAPPSRCRDIRQGSPGPSVGVRLA